ncbi:ferredoxin--NADP(+) reductase [Geobacillus thermocatenulatus]|uniref:Ferredoxin--NADP reductase n=2 Tax=Anoxybacillaceae TaxID=3120669 RepID=A0A226QCF6_9BACL|nr:ferredoxin--NADP(+) reductase [Geobacillus thermocatenulatus]KLR74246.1 ferredoxin-NADP reductase [Geobacillus sp. T6]OXB89112.1 ferredoxin--NADP(+) reductase [Geobacillus thermocatenulatus]RAN22307.1 ferredoxin-NADP reductase [Geobacillus sp. A8]
MKEDRTMYDVTIIGGGPTGMFAAFYGGLRQMKVKIIESLPQLGGQLAALYPEKYIYDVAGFPKVRAQELVNQLKEQMGLFSPTVCLNESVDTLEKQEDGTFKLVTNQQIHYSKTIIITAGNGAFQPRRLEIENASRYEGKNLHYFINDLEQFSGKRVLVCGGGDSAVDWSLMLEPIAQSVTIVHRRDKFRAHEHSVEQLMKSHVHVKTPFVPVELVGDEHAIRQVILEHVNEGTKETIDVDAVVVNYGFVSSLGPIKNWGLDIEKNAIKVNSRMETNIPGVYAAGDICTYDGKIKLIACGFGEAPIAISSAKTYIDPTARMQPAHSTSLF